MRFPERLVKHAFEAFLPGSVMRFAESQSHGESDFAWVLPGGAEEPVEVTVATDEVRQAAYAAIRGRSGDQMFVPRVMSSADWYIMPRPDANIRRLREGVDTRLAAVEAEGLSEFNYALHAYESNAVRAIGDELGVDGGFCLTHSRPGHIAIGYPGAMGVLSGYRVASVVDGIVNLPDNRAKLGRFTAPRRHLAVAFEGLDTLARASIQEGLVPELPIDLPPEITDVWTLTWSASIERATVWRYNSEHGWRDYGGVSVSRSLLEPERR